MARLPLRDKIFVGNGWRVAHAIRCALPGWLVVLPGQHVTSMVELSPEQTTSLGPLLVRLSKALTRVTGCSKTYVAMFAEAEGFQHLHIHLIPRAPDLPDELKGPKIFSYLHRAENEWVRVAEMDALAARLKANLDTDIATAG